MKELKIFIKTPDKNLNTKKSLLITDQCEKSLFENQLSKPDYFKFLNVTGKSRHGGRD